jgi:hypothetical protein
MLAWAQTPAGEQNGARASPSAGFAVLRVLHGRIRSGEHQSLMPVVAAHQVWRCTALPRISMISDVWSDAPTTRLCT